MAAQDYVNTVQGFYVAYYGRWADVEGLDFWTRTLDVANGNVDAVINAFGTSSEYLNTYAAFLEPGTSDITDPEGMVTQLYQFMFNRDPDAAGLAFYVDLLEGTNVSGENPDLRTASLAEIALIVYDGAPVGSNDRTILDNKVLVAVSATNTLIETGASYTGDDIADVQAILATVTSDPTTVVTAQDAADVFIRSGDISGQTFTLTTGQDIFNGGVGTDIIRGVAGLNEGEQDQTTLNSSDILDGGAGEDSLVVNMTGLQYLGGATVKNIETLTIGTNLAASAFDMNVNQGAFEVTGVNTLTYDQITTNEILVVQNVVPVAAGGVAPTMNWANENGSAAGTIATTYREATISGTADDQAVILMNVDATQNQGTADGTLLVAGGMETITITSTGTVAQNTLNNVQAAAGVLSIYNDVGNNDVRADVLSNGTLTKVVLEGDTAIGRVAGVVSATNGLTNRVWADSANVAGAVDGDLGITAAPSSSNLLSVGSRVTEIDATTMTAAANVRFTAKTDGAATNVTFKGGEAGDYVEFELGNVTATGNAGADTFAFITRAAGVTNSTYGSGDTINGGDGADTLLIGMNGIGTYTLSTTEFQNTTGIDVLDLRGAVNTVTVSSALVNGADAGKFEIHTDRVVRSAVDNALNPVAGTTNGTEDALLNVINLTDLSGTQGVKFVGGSGSDRLVLDNAAFNQNMELNGGTEETSVGNVAGDYDTLNVIDNAVLDRTDIANVSNFEGLVLVESGTGNTTFSLEMTEAFLLANTKATDLVAATTSINDTVFQIGTNNAANGNALEAGDVVSIDVTNLFNTATDTVKASVAARSIDTNVLTGAGVTVNYVYEGTTYANLAALTAAFPNVGGAAVLNGNDPVGWVDVMASAANAVAPLPPSGNTLTATAAGFDTSSGFLLTGGLATNLADTLNSTAAFLAGSTINMAGNIAGGTDTLNVTDAVTAGTVAGVNAALAASLSLEEVVLRGGSSANVVGLAGQNITAEAAAIFTLTGTGDGTGSGGADQITAGAGGSTLIGNGGNDTLQGAASSDSLVGGEGNDLILVTGGNDTVDAGIGDDVVFVALNAGEAHAVTLGAGNDNLLISNVIFTNGGVNTVTVADFNVLGDSLALSNGLVPVSTGIFYTQDNSAFAAPTNVGAGSVLEINGNSFQYINNANTAAVLQHLNTVMNVRSAALGEAVTVVAYNGAGTEASVYIAVDTVGGAGTAFDSLELVGVLTGVGTNSLIGDNFA